MVGRYYEQKKLLMHPKVLIAYAITRTDLTVFKVTPAFKVTRVYSKTVKTEIEKVIKKERERKKEIRREREKQRNRETETERERERKKERKGRGRE